MDLNDDFDIIFLFFMVISSYIINSPDKSHNKKTLLFKKFLTIESKLTIGIYTNKQKTQSFGLGFDNLDSLSVMAVELYIP